MHVHEGEESEEYLVARARVFVVSRVVETRLFSVRQAKVDGHFFLFSLENDPA